MDTHKKFTKEHSITFPLIVDPKRAIRNRYAPGRITYLIDKQGIIRYVQEGVPVNKDFLKALKKLK